MDRIDIGLRYRVERIVRQIAGQHESLNALYADLASAFGKVSPAQVSELYERYAEAVCAHFSLEEACLFPACRGFDPELGSELEEICREHEFFVKEMVQLHPRLFEEQSDGKSVLAEFRAAIEAHERKEEDLVRGLLEADTGAERVSTTSRS